MRVLCAAVATLLAVVCLGGCGANKESAPAASAPHSEEHQIEQDRSWSIWESAAAISEPPSGGDKAAPHPTVAEPTTPEPELAPAAPRLGTARSILANEFSAESEPASVEPPMAAPFAARSVAPAQPADAPWTGNELPEAPMATESASAAESVPADQPWCTVEVFYATDRSRLRDSSVTDEAWPAEFRFPLVATIVTMLLYLFAGHMVGRNGATVLTATCGAAAVAGFILAGYSVVTTANVHPGVRYGNGRGTLEYGTCEVTIPATHKTGELESPSILRLELFEDPSKHIVFQGATEMPVDSYFELMQQRVERSDSHDAFVFVHGFNVTFEDAVRRTAQIAKDLKFQGAPICYSWPSQGGLLQYTVDENNVEWTVPHLKQFLIDVAARSGARNISLVAHSMGNRALTNALRQLSYELTGAPPFREIVLTAPDIDADIFRRDIAPAIRRMGQRVTLYASSNDEALLLSKQIHGYPRAGDSGQGLVVLPGIDTIDVSTVDTSFIGHSYYGSNATVLDDLFSLIRESKPVYERSWLRSMSRNGLMYWIFDRALARAQAAPAPR